ncbi:MAG: hypothetical protein HGA45_05355 [Chloroflexales bacterium]|nr:hypothetical protein [Chloroflexales bacterium]
MSQPARTRRHGGLPTPALVAVPLLLIALAVGFAMTRPKTAATIPPPAQAAVPHFIDTKAPGEPRTLVIAGMRETLPGTSNEAGQLMANLRAGQLPTGATAATVLTDANCAPDGDGVSHCLNDLQIGNVVVTVQHHHKMASVPCLSPGETVTLMSYADYQRQL